MKDVLLVKYGEIALRGKNRHLYENKLIGIIKRNIGQTGEYYVRKEQGRVLIDKPDGSNVDYDYLIPKVLNIFGIIGVSPCIVLDDQELDTIQKSALIYMQRTVPDKNITFKVETRRSNKRYPHESREVSAQVGGYLLEHMPNLKVDVHHPQMKVWVELRNQAYIYSDTIVGFGGLPVGSSGKATLLLSGGIDSPVAGFLAAKRGAEIEAVYFDSPPYTSSRAADKVRDLAAKLSEYTGGIKLYIVPFTDTQLLLKEHIPPEKLTILIKRSMLKIAEIIASKSGSLALITGDSVGQVASQTLQSIFAIDSAASYPVLRPLSGMDKQEIADLAEKIGTFEISVRPYEDCCTVFLADYPETRPKKSIIESFENNIPELDSCHQKAAASAEIVWL